MNEEELFDQAFWVSVALTLPELQNDPEGAEHLMERFVGQYLPALLRSRLEEQRDHVWLAFWNYIVAPRTNRKPFSLVSAKADILIGKIQDELSGLS